MSDACFSPPTWPAHRKSCCTFRARIHPLGSQNFAQTSSFGTLLERSDIRPPPGGIKSSRRHGTSTSRASSSTTSLTYSPSSIMDPLDSTSAWGGDAAAPGASSSASESANGQWGGSGASTTSGPAPGPSSPSATSSFGANTSDKVPDVREPRTYGEPVPALAEPTRQPTAPYLRVRIAGVDRNRKDLLVRFDTSVSRPFAFSFTIDSLRLSQRSRHYQRVCSGFRSSSPVLTRRPTSRTIAKRCTATGSDPMRSSSGSPSRRSSCAHKVSRSDAFPADA